MTAAARVFWLLFAVVVVAIAACFVAGFMPPQALVTLFSDAVPTTKLADVALMLSLAAVVVMGLKSKAGGSSLLEFMTWAGPILGAATVLFEGIAIVQGVHRAHVTHFAVVAPSVAEALLPLALGLLTGALAAQFSRRRSG